MIVHFFNINKEVTFRKDRYFVFRIRNDKLELIATFAGKRLSVEDTYDEYWGYSGYEFKTNNYFTRSYSNGEPYESAIFSLPDIKFDFNKRTSKITRLY